MNWIKMPIPSLFSRLNQRLRQPPSKGQSLIELALVLPVMILLLLGIAETAMFMGRYLDLLDLTREAAREASRDDPFALEPGVAAPTTLTGTTACTSDATLSAQENFYYKAACFFSPPPPVAPATCNAGGQSPNFCSGFNRYVDFDIRTDDVLISVYTINQSSANRVTDVWPNATTSPGHAEYWALSNDGNAGGKMTYIDSGGNTQTVAGNTWQKDCQGNATGATPHFTRSVLETQVNGTDLNAPDLRGYVGVEVYYCYHQILGIPLFTNFVPNPMRIHAYTLMPLPNAQPTPVP